MSQVKRKIRQSFGNASGSYDYAAKLQAKVGNTLLQQIRQVNNISVVLDLGCGTGFLAHSLLTQSEQVSGQILALDIAMPMLTLAREKLDHANARYVCADAERLPLAGQSVDLVMSNFALQWCENLAGSIAEVKRVLKPDGHFMFTIFAENTLYELKDAWRQVDKYQHVNNFINISQLTEMLTNAGFSIKRLTTENYVSVYESVWDLMAELKQLGAQTVMAGKKRQLTTKTNMQRMIAAYQQNAKDGLVPATFEVISVIAVSG